MTEAGVMRIVLAGPDAVEFGPDVRASLMAAIAAPVPPPALIIFLQAAAARGAGRRAVQTELSPSPSDIAAAMAEAPFPILVSLSGNVAGPFTEIALAGDLILASADARLGVPDIQFGLVPGGGATQGLPRRLGAKGALDLLLSGRSIGASEAARIGLVDRVVSGDLDKAATLLGAEMAALPRPERPRKAPDAKTFAAEIAQARGALMLGGLPAADRMIDAVEAALVLPYAQGLVLEETLRADLLGTDDVLGLAAAEAAERIARRVPRPLMGVQAGPVSHLYAEGMSPRLAPLVTAALSAGLRVTLAEGDREALSAVLKTVAEMQDAAVSKGHLEIAKRDDDWSRLATLTPGPLLPEGVDAMLFGPEKGMRIAELAGSAGPDVPRLAMEALPGGLVMAIAPSGRVATLSGVTGSVASATARALLQRIGLMPVVIGGDGASPGAAIAAAGKTALTRLLSKGVRPEAVEAALVALQATKPDLPHEAFDPRANGGQPLVMPRPEIIARWWSAMAAAGLDCLAGGTAICPADIDHLMVAGYGFPRRLGGPMYQADRRGLLLLRQDLRLWSRDDRIWAPPPMLDKLISDGRTIPSLNPRPASAVSPG